jgi:hypothetical protein
MSFFILNFKEKTEPKERKLYRIFGDDDFLKGNSLLAPLFANKALKEEVFSNQKAYPFNDTIGNLSMNPYLFNN